MSPNSVDYNETEYSVQQNNIFSLNVPNVCLYGSEFLLSLILEIPSSVVIYAFATLSLVTLWYFLFWRPFDWNRDISDLGFDDVKSAYPNLQTQKIVINGLLRKKKSGELPPVYPNGWLIILETDDLPKKTTKEINVLGLRLLAWRGESGKSYVADAYCAYLGTSFGVDGKVFKECIEYLSNELRVSGLDGKVKNISGDISTDAVLDNIKIWETMEMNGFIYLWYHAEGETPSWRPPIFPQIESGQWKYRGRSEFKVACHIQEIPENGADVAHLNVVHKPAMMTGGKPNNSFFKWSFLKHVWGASWAANDQPGEEYKALMKVHHHMSIFNKNSLMTMDVEAHQHMIRR